MATTAIGYIRVSTAKQADHGVSLEAQKEPLTAYTKRYDLERVELIVDVAESAKGLNRSSLQKALAMLAKQEARNRLKRLSEQRGEADGDVIAAALEAA